MEYTYQRNVFSLKRDGVKRSFILTALVTELWQTEQMRSMVLFSPGTVQPLSQE